MQSPSQRASERGPDSVNGPSSRAIYIVDDDDAVRDSLQMLLETEGFEVVGFESCAAALSAIERSHPACLLLDLHLPGVGGLDMLAELAARGLHIPVVMISGRIDRRTRQIAVASGAKAVLEKPLDDEELMQAIRRVTVGPRPGNAGEAV
jgi:two-component system response regulator FixJ